MLIFNNAVKCSFAALNKSQTQQGRLKAEPANQTSQAETCCLCKVFMVNTFKEEHKKTKASLQQFYNHIKVAGLGYYSAALFIINKLV